MSFRDKLEALSAMHDSEVTDLRNEVVGLQELVVQYQLLLDKVQDDYRRVRGELLCAASDGPEMFDLMQEIAGEMRSGYLMEEVSESTSDATRVRSKASSLAGRCFPTARGSLAGEPEAASSPADEPGESEAQPACQATPPAAAEASPEEPAPEDPSLDVSRSQRPLEPEPALHFECSDLEDAAAGKAAKGCCMPRASRRRARATKAARHEEQEVNATADSVKAKGSPESQQQGESEGKRGKSRASAGA